MSRSWLLFLDDLIAAAEKVGRLVGSPAPTDWAMDEAAFDSTLSGPVRLRDLIAQRYSSTS